MSGSVAVSSVAGAKHRLWILYLVPNVPGGRWWSAAGIFALLGTLFFAFGVADSALGWPTALYFCTSLAYITPMFHFVTRTTEAAFDDLTEHIPVDTGRLAQWRSQISKKSGLWLLINISLGTLLWLIQSWLLAGSFTTMKFFLTSGVNTLVMALSPLIVWIFLTCVMHALMDNARLFRRLASQVTIDYLDPLPLMPFGRMAVSSTLIVIGAQALFPIMWLGSQTNPWTTIPGLIGTTAPLIFLFLAPIWPIHKRLREIKRAELAGVQQEINSVRRSEQPSNALTLTPLLTYRREIATTTEWPFDLSIVARFGLYLIIVPLTWIGAALIEQLLEVLIEN